MVGHLTLLGLLAMVLTSQFLFTMNVNNAPQHLVVGIWTCTKEHSGCFDLNPFEHSKGILSGKQRL